MTQDRTVALVHGSVTYVFECSQCRNVERQSFDFDAGNYLPIAVMLDGWQWVGDRLICPKHRVRVEDAEPEPVYPELLKAARDFAALVNKL